MLFRKTTKKLKRKLDQNVSRRSQNDFKIIAISLIVTLAIGGTAMWGIPKVIEILDRRAQIIKLQEENSNKRGVFCWVPALENKKSFYYTMTTDEIASLETHIGIQEFTDTTAAEMAKKISTKTGYYFEATVGDTGGEDRYYIRVSKDLNYIYLNNYLDTTDAEWHVANCNDAFKSFLSTLIQHGKDAEFNNMGYKTIAHNYGLE